jgi:hypothetical protein
VSLVIVAQLTPISPRYYDPVQFSGGFSSHLSRGDGHASYRYERSEILSCFRQLRRCRALYSVRHEARGTEQASPIYGSVHAAAPFELYVATRLYAKRQTYDDVMRSGLSLIGGVQTVTRKLKQLEEMGVHHVLAIHNFGMMPQHQVMMSMDRFAEIAKRMNETSSVATDNKKSLVA